MDSFSANSESHIDPIVNQEWYIVRARNGVKLLSNSDKVCSLTGLVSVLYDCYALAIGSVNVV